MAGMLPELRGKKYVFNFNQVLRDQDIYPRVVLPLCGGNIDTTLLGRCLDRGLAADGRLITFNVVVSDRPGGIAELAKLISSMGVSIKVGLTIIFIR